MKPKLIWLAAILFAAIPAHAQRIVGGRAFEGDWMGTACGEINAVPPVAVALQIEGDRATVTGMVVDGEMRDLYTSAVIMWTTNGDDTLAIFVVPDGTGQYLKFSLTMDGTHLGGEMQLYGSDGTIIRDYLVAFVPDTFEGDLLRFYRSNQDACLGVREQIVPPQYNPNLER